MTLVRLQRSDNQQSADNKSIISTYRDFFWPREMSLDINNDAVNCESCLNTILPLFQVRQVVDRHNNIGTIIHGESSAPKNEKKYSFLRAWKVEVELHFIPSPTTYIEIQRANFTEIQEEFGEGQFFKKIKTAK